MPSVIVACATRMSEKDFYEKSALGRCLAQTYKHYPIKRKIFFENTRGLGECYNEAIDSTEDDEDMIVFVHDDVLILDFFWIDKLVYGFEHCALLGLAGNIRRVPRQPAWAFIDANFTWDDADNLSGAVAHGNGFPSELSWFGRPMQACKLLDGVLLAAQKKSFTRHNIRFDEAFKFHFYDMDICRQFESKNLKIGTIPLPIVHESGGNFGSLPWRENYEKYLKKWGE